MFRKKKRKIRNKQKFVRRIKKQYRGSNEKYKNPFFEKRGIKRKTGRRAFVSFRVKVFALLFVAVLLLFFWLALFSGYFNIKRVNVKGGGRIDVSEVEQIARKKMREYKYKFIPNQSFFSFNVFELEGELNDKYSFNRLEVRKKFPSTLEIDFEEKNYAMIWSEEGEFFYIDELGFVVEPVSVEEASGKKYPLVENRFSDLMSGEYVGVRKEYLKAIQEMSTKFSMEDFGISVAKYVLGPDYYQITVEVENGPEIYFSISSSIEKQIKKLLVAKDDIIKERFFEVEYIDIRVGDSVYFK